MRVLPALLAVCSCIFQHSFATETVPGTRVVLEPPPGFEKAEQFPGFVQKTANASIMVSEVPGPYAEVTKGFTPAGLATKQMRFVDKRDATAAGRNGILLRATQEAFGTTFAKWMLAFPDGEKTTLIVASYPQSAEGELGELLRRTILSVTLSDHTPGLTEGLTFEVAERPPLRITQRVGNSVIMTTEQNTENAPLLVVGASVTHGVRIPNPSAHAKARLRQTEHLEQIDLLAEKPVAIDGLPGITLLSLGRDKRNGATQFLLQTTLYDENGYFIAQGLAPADQRETYEPLFEAIIATLRRRK